MYELWALCLWTLHLLDSLAEFAYCLVILPSGHFVVLALLWLCLHADLNYLLLVELLQCGIGLLVLSYFYFFLCSPCTSKQNTWSQCTLRLWTTRRGTKHLLAYVLYLFLADRLLTASADSELVSAYSVNAYHRNTYGHSLCVFYNMYVSTSFSCISCPDTLTSLLCDWSKLWKLKAILKLSLDSIDLTYL